MLIINQQVNELLINGVGVLHKIGLSINALHTTNYIHYLISHLDIPSYMLIQKRFL
ncbi:MAG: hypothetical protein ACTS8R_03660 [Arsenophonus sp. NC-QC1-MAG3]